jgi:hypothetical protein
MFLLSTITTIAIKIVSEVGSYTIQNLVNSIFSIRVMSKMFNVKFLQGKGMTTIHHRDAK